MDKTKTGGDNFSESLSKNSTKLSFTIRKCSSYSSIYVPQNILQDKPWDPNSRWSSGSSTPPQFLILRLEKTAILESITFGKLDKPHVCNVRKFKIFAGLTEENMTEVVESGLRNDCYPETFALNNRINGYVFPCRYIKIVPLQSWGPSFNFSIWYVEIHGIDDCDIVQPQIVKFNNFKEREAIRVCLKHLRDHNYMEAFTALQRRTNVKLEHPKVSELHEMLVLQGNFAGVERFLEDCSETHLFHKFIMEQDYKGVWNQILTNSEAEIEESGEHTDSTKPRMRGGHQMCIDVDTEQIYLFGGWDGHQELADFWTYKIPLGKWTLLSENTEAEGGPSARSCHRMILDQERRQIFTLGRFLECQFPARSEMKSDFYVYELDTNKWTLISDDTNAAGGPELIFDHQMCIDSEKSLMYVFGGRILAGTIGISEPSPNSQNSRDRDEEIIRFPDPLSPSSLTLSPLSSEYRYSGLYSYHIPTDTWTLLRSDINSEKKTADRIKSRVGHSLLFHKDLRKLFIFAGQRAREYLNDFFSYDVDNDEIEMISEGGKGVSVMDAPSTGFTQRATIDPELNEIYVFSGSVKDKDKRDESLVVQNAFWVYDVRRNVWSCAYKNDGTTEISGSQLSDPYPRFAHQLVYDQHTKIHYLFGGNPGRSKDPKLRLDDFWSLKLLRPAKSDVLLECRLMLRKQQFEELVSEDSLAALHYLQTSLSELVKHDDPVQSKEFQKLSHLLFSTSLSQSPEGDGESSSAINRRDDARLLKRSQIFDKLVRFFPEEMTQPRVNLIDLLTF